jgi:hypothetical protein
MAPKNVVGQNLLITSSPVVADIDPTSAGYEILFGLGPEICVVSASGQQLTANNTNSSKPTLWVGLSPVANSPAVADIDRDGYLEIIAAGEYYPITNQVRNYHGWVVAYRWPNSQRINESFRGNVPNTISPWPMFRRDPSHTAQAAPAGPVVPPEPSKVTLPLIVK